jgi:hypothetical protein
VSNPVISTALVGALGWSLSDEDPQAIDAVFEKYGVDPQPDVWVA